MSLLETGLEADRLLPLELKALPARPTVSVLMSNYNYARYIEAAIESVLCQTYPYFELIICDDGSTDDSVSVIKRRLNDARIRLIQKQNGGQATGFNAAFGECKGDIVCFLDADDFYTPTKMERVVESLKNHPDCGCALHGWLNIDQHLDPRGVFPLLTALPSGWCGLEALERGGILPNMPCTPGLNLRREVAEALFPMPTVPPLNRFPDMVIMRLVPLVSRLAAIAEPLAKKRLHTANTYQTSRITRESLEHEIEICGHLWQEQKRRLGDIDSSLPGLLTPLDTSAAILQEMYVCARLAGAPEQGVYLRRLQAAFRAEGDPWWKRAFWSGTAYIPQALFSALINVALAPNRFKEAIYKLRRLGKMAGANAR